MKVISKYLSVVLVVLFCAGLPLQAQSKKEKEEKAKQIEEFEKQMKLEQIERTKELEKALKESKLMEAEELKSLFEDQKQLQEDVIRNYRKSMEKLKDENATSWRFAVPEIEVENWKTGEPLVLRSAFGFHSGESTSLNIHKDIEDLTFGSKFKYDVQEGSKSFYFGASGSVDQGIIRIQLLDPANKIIHEFEVSPLADVEWSQNLKWSEEDAKKNYGTWTIVVTAEKATGSYHVNVKAN